MKFEAVSHPAYRPDLAASDLNLFGTLKRAVGDRHVADDA
jgi:hypothetical protein